MRKVLFRLDAERAHELALWGLALMHKHPPLQAAFAPDPPSPRLASQVCGIKFPAPLGVAAGFDKGGRVYNALLALGFGHVEVGTVTPQPQPGNDKPRIERLPRHYALVNRLGFPNPGAGEVVNRFADHAAQGIIGANIGPNKQTPADNVSDDIDACAFHLAPYADYITVNVSSPNTAGLRALQEPAAVSRIIRRTLESIAHSRRPIPVLLKLHPDVEDAELVRVARAAVDAGAAGIVATNTTRARPPGTEHAMEGGLSGAPLRERARNAIAALYHGLGRNVPIVGVGGVFTAEDAWNHIAAGASVLQTYTGFVYAGPRMPHEVHSGLLYALDHAGLDRLDELVGTAGPPPHTSPSPPSPTALPGTPFGVQGAALCGS